jgi:gliding motility-associated-like protein
LMRPISLKLFLPAIIIIAFTLQTYAQTCTGSLGDPVINQDFGSGSNPGPPLAIGITNMAYTTNNCPNDGQYTIANSLTGSGNCHPDTWQNVTSDHTGNPNGYMMIVNASYQPSIFFTQTASGLCPNTTYEFSSYILNLITLAASGPGVSEPNITFSIQTTSGQILAIDSTGTIPPTATPTWVKYGTYFTTPANVADVIVTMTNNAPGGNGNDLILDDITFRACGPIINLGFASTAGPVTKELCQGGSAVYNLKATVLGNNSPSYQWQSNINGNGWVDVPGDIADSVNVSFNNAVTGVYQYRLGVANGSNITSVQCRVYSPPLTINVNPLPVVTAIAPQTICEGTTLQLTASGGASYIWSGPNIANTTQNPLIINNVSLANSGAYSVTALSDSGCVGAPVSALVSVTPKIVPVISNNVAVCSGEPTQLTASGGLYYKWTPPIGLNNDSIPNPVATPLQTTTYTVDVSNGACSDSTKSVTVTVIQTPVADAGGNKVIFEGQSVKLNGTVKGGGILTYSWTPTTGLDDPASLTPIASPTDNITYTLTAVSQNCGSSTSSVFVRVYKKITIPNTFSPNNDGINDYWDIDALVTYPESSIMVFDRYGQKVYQNIGYPNPWDGTYNGSPLPQGTYYYIIDLKNNTPKLTGWVLIVR